MEQYRGLFTNMWVPEDIVKCVGNVTKRFVVSTVAKVYDPLGFATPVTFYDKVFLQTLWTNELD